MREEYPELTGEGREDAFLDEVLAQYSGKHGKERLREIAEEIAKNNGGDMTAKTMAEIAVRKLKNVLDTFWRGVSRMMGWKYTTAEEVADKVLHDLLSGVNPTETLRTEKGGKENKENSFSLGGNSVSLHSERDVEAVRGQRERFSPTAPWRDGVEDVVVHTTLGTLKGKHAELYNKAKAGDTEAALELISKVVKPEKVKALAEAYPEATVVPVHAEEALGRNQIPNAYAKQFEKYGLTVDHNILQINKPFHTGSDRVGRVIRRARFDGEVEADKEYILVDDHITMGSTLRDLKDYIEGKGGKVVAISTLTASAGATKLRPTEQQKQQLKERGVTNEQLRELGIADSADGLTRREAQEILVLANTRGNRRSSQGQERVSGTDENSNLTNDAQEKPELTDGVVGRGYVCSHVIPQCRRV